MRIRSYGEIKNHYGYIKTWEEPQHLSIGVGMVIEKQVEHKRVVKVFQSNIMDHEAKDIADVYSEFIEDIENYYKLPAI